MIKEKEKETIKNYEKAKQKVIERQKKKRRKAIRSNVFVMFFFLFIIFMALSLTVFFNVENIVITGVTKYEISDVEEISGVTKGDNLFRLYKSHVEAKIKLYFPYVKGVDLKLSLPNKLKINIIEEVESGAIDDGEYYTILSADNRILKTKQIDLPENTSLIKGIYVENLIEGAYMEIGNIEKGEILKEIYNVLDAFSIENVTVVDLEDINDINIHIGEYRVINLGDSIDIGYKINMYNEINKKHLSPEEKVVINCKNPKRVIVTPIKN
ncbi:MAG: cell division protein FtsQ/DivIB [Oscillospiraceae bacterium]